MEMMIALVIIMVSMMALLTALTSSVKTNRENEVRNTGIRVANQTAEALLALNSEDTELTVGSHTRTPGNTAQATKGIPDTSQMIRSSVTSTMTYSIAWVVSQLASGATPSSPVPNLKQVNVTVSYTMNNMQLNHDVVAYKSSAL